MVGFLWILLWLTAVSTADAGVFAQFEPGGSGPETDAPEEREGRPCVECHDAISRAFAETRMAEAASGTDFIAEWKEKGQPDWCTDCHAPSGGRGVACADCHGTGPHPYPKVQVPDACARCHDAPGESTVRRYLAGPAARRGEDCLSCHLPDVSPGADHAFQGPSAPGFLEDVADVRAFVREEKDGETALVIRINHRAGHALPGGTTGRSVWLLVQGIRDEGAEIWRETQRFGWEHDADRGWLDRTLPPGRPTIFELPEPRRSGTVKLRAELWYRFRPGPLTEQDPRAVRLDQLELDLRR